jgi:phage terminase small subunit
MVKPATANRIAGAVEQPSAKPGATPLRPLWERFCRAYIDQADFDATEAIKVAGYKGKYANRVSYRMMKYTAIQERIAYLAEQALGRVGVNAFRIVRESARIAFSDITQVLVDDDGRLDPDLPPEITATIKKFKRTVRTRRFKDDEDEIVVTAEVELHPKQPALEQLFKYRNLYPSDMAGGGSDRPLRVVIVEE